MLLRSAYSTTMASLCVSIEFSIELPGPNGCRQLDPSATFMFSIRYMACGFNKFRELTIGHLLMTIYVEGMKPNATKPRIRNRISGPKLWSVHSLPRRQLYKQCLLG